MYVWFRCRYGVRLLRSKRDTSAAAGAGEPPKTATTWTDVPPTRNLHVRLAPEHGVPQCWKCAPPFGIAFRVTCVPTEYGNGQAVASHTLPVVESVTLPGPRLRIS